jgi:hypothetical protein
VIRIDDSRSDPRWPGYMAEARKNGVLSQLCIPVRADERGLGPLSLYAADASAFTETGELTVSRTQGARMLGSRGLLQRGDELRCGCEEPVLLRLGAADLDQSEVGKPGLEERRRCLGHRVYGIAAGN